MGRIPPQDGPQADGPATSYGVCMREGGVYPPLVEAMEEAVLQYVETYIYRCQNTSTPFIATRPIINLFMEADRRPGSQVTKRWWGQLGLDFEGMPVAALDLE